MDFLLDLFKAQVLSKVEEGIKERLAPLPVYLRQLGIGVAVLVSSSIPWSGALLFLILAVFFALAHLPYAVASFYTAAICAGVGAIMVLIGTLLVRKPR